MNEKVNLRPWSKRSARAGPATELRIASTREKTTKPSPQRKTEKIRNWEIRNTRAERARGESTRLECWLKIQ